MLSLDLICQQKLHSSVQELFHFYIYPFNIWKSNSFEKQLQTYAGKS